MTDEDVIYLKRSARRRIDDLTHLVFFIYFGAFLIILTPWRGMALFLMWPITAINSHKEQLRIHHDHVEVHVSDISIDDLQYYIDRPVWKIIFGRY